MNQSMKSMAEGLKTAVQMEADGYNFYNMVADTTRDSRGRQVFRTLANEELGHLNFLKSQYKSIVETGRVDSTVSLGSRQDLAGSSPIFTDEVMKRIGSAHIEMTALSIGIQLELGSIKFYEEQARKAPDADVRKFYDELVKWESGHYHALLRQQELLKEDYWSESQFAPF